ncbi:MAG: sulfatase [Verrucomicrobia bacterium]|nr:sulfatase [Verrucomicrobiota bacterium]
MGIIGCLLGEWDISLSNEPPDKKPPNVVFILVDDLGWKDVGFMGSTYYETPNIDKLAGEGMVFTDAYSNAPNCAPTRACLLSGQYTPRHGIYTVGTSKRGKSVYRRIIPVENTTVLDPRIPTIADDLKQAGYTSASIGKWHLGADPESGPISQGFDENVGGDKSGHPRNYFSPYHNTNLEDGPKGEYLTDRLTDEAVEFIQANRENPFFLYLSHYAVHTPLQAKDSLIKKYRDKNPDGGQNNPIYAAMIESMDSGVGRILEKLGQLGLEENTVVIFFSDNGGHGGVTDMSPLRGSKGMLYEGGIRVPMIVKWPGVVEPGSSCDVPVISLDFYPTLLEISGAKVPPGHVIDGESIVKLLNGGDKLERNAIFWHFPAYLESYTSEQGVWRTTPTGAVRVGDYKLLEYFDNGKIELYNLEEDIGEQNDISSKMPSKTKELMKILKQWRNDIDAPVPIEINPQFDEDKFIKRHESLISD